MAGVIPAYPDESLQGFVGAWWTAPAGTDFRRGRLVRVVIPHVDQEPYQLTPIGRDEPTEHRSATVLIEPLRLGQPRRTSKLPVAAMPTNPGELRIVSRAKVRPAVILSAPMPEVPKEMRQGKARWQSAPTLLVAPYYGGDQDGTRGGWDPRMVDRIRRCEYPQYLWDKLPVAGATESILRLDHIQPIGRHSNACEVTSYCLSDEALGVLDEWLTWLTTGLLPSRGVLADVRNFLLGSEAPAT
ncbi:MAG: hypothetical protein U0807_15225 [Candidatus Binatia bacterium]